jgi:hypothetical protein
MRPIVSVAILAIATVAACPQARAFTNETPGGGSAKGAPPAPAPEPRAPGQGLGKPPTGPSGGYSFSGTSFNFSVTKTKRPGEAAATPARVVVPPSGDPPSARPGFFRRVLNWIAGD